jgi:hypothetical protein
MNYKKELKEFLTNNLDKKKYEIFEVNQGFLIRFENNGTICFKFSDVGMVKMLKEDVNLTQEKLFSDFLSKVKKELKYQKQEIKNIK